MKTKIFSIICLLVCLSLLSCNNSLDDTDTSDTAPRELTVEEVKNLFQNFDWEDHSHHQEQIDKAIAENYACVPFPCRVQFNSPVQLKTCFSASKEKSADDFREWAFSTENITDNNNISETATVTAAEIMYNLPIPISFVNTDAEGDFCIRMNLDHTTDATVDVIYDLDGIKYHFSCSFDTDDLPTYEGATAIDKKLIVGDKTVDLYTVRSSDEESGETKTTVSGHFLTDYGYVSVLISDLTEIPDSFSTFEFSTLREEFTPVMPIICE